MAQPRHIRLDKMNFHESLTSNRNKRCYLIKTINLKIGQLVVERQFEPHDLLKIDMKRG